MAVGTYAGVGLGRELANHRLWKDAAVHWRLCFDAADPSTSRDRSFFVLVLGLARSETSEFLPASTRACALRHILHMNQSGFYRSKRLMPYYHYRLRHALAGLRLDQGNLDDAVRQMHRALDIGPAGIEVGENYVNRLAKAGRPEDADRIFGRIESFMWPICRRHPRAAMYANNLAWLYARCNRKLDRAEKLARRAVELEPDSATYLDTLAEVVFLKGNVRQAVELARKCVELDPYHYHYQRQLKRFQQALEPGAPSS